MPEHQKKILLVDDDRLILQLFSKALSDAGFQCLTASSAKQALLMLKDEVPDLILSDYQMPRFDGFMFRKRILYDKRLRNIPFVFLTSFTNRDLMQMGLNMEAVDYIDKETPVALVVAKLNNILNTIRLQHEKSINEIRVAAEALNLRSVPAETPVIEGYEISFLYKSFENYPGGDFIDFIPVDKNYTFIVLGDVMGKKWGAWFFSFNFLSYIRSAIRLCVLDGNFSTASILHRLNKVIFMDPVLSDVLSTLSLMMLEHSTGKLHYSGAGDLPLIWYDSRNACCLQVKSEGLLLGVLPNSEYDEKIISLGSGDQLFALSDGMIDFEKDGEKRSDYDFFFNKIKSGAGNNDTFKTIKDETFSVEKSKELIDDCSLIFIQKN